MSDLRLGWYWRRLRGMSPAELGRRLGDHGLKWSWRRRQVLPGDFSAHVLRPEPRPFTQRLSPSLASAVPEPARRELLKAAEGLLRGDWLVLGVQRKDISSPDWFLDPLTGRRAPQERYAFRVNHRSESETGNIKQVWELSRHHHLTLLAAAWFVSHDDRFAEVVARQLRSWWAENPFLSGIHWTSGIELGVRLISWTWVRRLLDGWAGTTELFDENPVAALQIFWHQQYLARFRSSGSSANNHVIAEASGQLVASCAFPWFRESDSWRSSAAGVLERELERNTFPSGINRELASAYHAFVAELGLVAAVEARAAGHPLSDSTCQRLCRMVDAAAAIVDEDLQGPRQGDGDDAFVLLVDAPDDNRWSSLLATGARLFGPLSWWPSMPRGDIRSLLLDDLARPAKDVPDRPHERPSHFADAGMTLLRTPPLDHPEIWCRCDAGPHGFLSIAAHAHADALSIEVRHGGVEILTDPGTYCYHGEPQCRDYFRSTVGHNTLELGGENQSTAGGPFLWVRHAESRLLHVLVESDDGLEWSAEHDGYRALDPPAIHRRTVRLDGHQRRLDVVDSVRTEGQHRCRLAFHLGPTVSAALEGAAASLKWSSDGVTASASLRLPSALSWEAHRGKTEPILGWHSPGFGRKQPTTTLLGIGTCGAGDADLVTILQFER